MKAANFQVIIEIAMQFLWILRLSWFFWKYQFFARYFRFPLGLNHIYHSIPVPWVEFLCMVFIILRLVDRFLIDGYKPQQLSTYALSLFRHRTTVNEEKVLIGRETITHQVFYIFTYLELFLFKCFGYFWHWNVLLTFWRFLGHSRPRALSVYARVLLPPSPRLHPRVRRHQEEHLQELGQLVRGDEEKQT